MTVIVRNAGVGLLIQKPKVEAGLYFLLPFWFEIGVATRS
jgi:hypothetical protein